MTLFLGGPWRIEENQRRWGPFGGCTAIARGMAASGYQVIPALQAASPAGSRQRCHTACTGNGAERGASHPTWQLIRAAKPL